MQGCLDFLQYVYGTFGFSFNLKLSTRPEKYLGDIQVWNEAEEVSLIHCKLINLSFSLSVRGGV